MRYHEQDAEAERVERESQRRELEQVQELKQRERERRERDEERERLLYESKQAQKPIQRQMDQRQDYRQLKHERIRCERAHRQHELEITVGQTTRHLEELDWVPLNKELFDHFLKVLTIVIATEWIARGGRDLPQPAQLFIEGTISALCKNLNYRSGEFDLFDDKGLPYLPTPRQYTDAVSEVVMDSIIELVSNKLSVHGKQWPTELFPRLTDRVFQITSESIALMKAKESTQLSAANDLAEYQSKNPHPLPQPYGVTPRGAELWIRDWMIHMGASDAEVTQATNDGGIDVVATGWVAQVKLYKGTASITEIRELAGSGLVFPDQPRTLFFCSGGYPESAASYASGVGMALFEFSAESGEVLARNDVAERILITGLIADEG
ncbi:MAG: restriction endonuclease [Canibacter sp.]